MPRNPLPPLTPEQRKAALARATEARQARSQIKADIAAGTVTVSAILERAKEDDIVGKMRVVDMLASLPRIGQVRARAVMEELNIAESRRLRGLGPTQARALIDRFS